MTLENRQKMAKLYLEGKAPQYKIYAESLGMIPNKAEKKPEPKKEPEPKKPKKRAKK